jgi:hypothetical protein
MTNYKLIAIKLGDNLKYGNSVKEINRIANAVFPFNKKEHPNESITSVRAQEVYNWILTLSEEKLPENDKIKLLSNFINELAPEFALSKISEGFEIVNKSTDKHIDGIANSRDVFVLMPFEQKFQTIYYNVLKPLIESLGYSASKADENLRIGTVIEQIQQSIKDAFLIIADVSGKNPNVFYELGYAHGLNKNVLIMTSDPNDVPFDISHIRYFQYSFNPNFDIMKQQFYPMLKKNLEVIENE